MLLLAGIWICACQDNDDVKPSNEGLNEFRVKEIVGHKISDITEKVYTHRNIDELYAEINKIK